MMRARSFLSRALLASVRSSVPVLVLAFMAAGLVSIPTSSGQPPVFVGPPVPVEWKIEIAGTGWPNRQQRVVRAPANMVPLTAAGAWSCNYTVGNSGYLAIHCERNGAEVSTTGLCEPGARLDLFVVDSDAARTARRILALCRPAH